MKVLFIAAEGAPFVKTGGLGDVVGALPKAINDEGIDARVVLPLYSSIDRNKYKITFLKYIYVSLGWRHIYCGVFEAEYSGVKYYFIDNEHYFKRSNIYGEYDDGERFAFFSKAALEILPHIDFKADIINVNDWHAALSVVYLDTFKRDGFEFYKDMKTVLSIHNIEFQGKYNPYILGSLFGLGNEYLDIMTYDGDINLLKGAIQLSDRINTVSSTYADEILNPYFAFGLDKILYVEKKKLRGIVNGIDYSKFNPEKDSAIFKKYNIKNIDFKSKNKMALQKEMALEVNPDIPMIGMVTRLTDQKGISLVLEVAEQILSLGVQLVILGTGDVEIENRLRELEYFNHDKVRSIILFSNELSSKIYSAADLYLMPSKSEPCGLSQLIAMKYGTIPVVHRVGGLKDTVQPYNNETKDGCGFTFESFNAHDMLDAIRRGVELYQTDKKSWKQLIKNAMSYDSDWKKSAKEYIKMYEELV